MPILLEIISLPSRISSVPVIPLPAAAELVSVRQIAVLRNNKKTYKLVIRDALFWWQR